jgi:hypothetical protein
MMQSVLRTAVTLLYCHSWCTSGWQEWGFSEEASFVAPPPVGPDTSVKVLVVADLGQAELDGSMEESSMVSSLNTTAGVLQAVKRDGYQLLMHNGDISYARGYVTQVSQKIPWRSLGDPLEIPWRSLGDPLEIPWRSLGDPLEIPWRSLGDPLEMHFLIFPC